MKKICNSFIVSVLLTVLLTSCINVPAYEKIEVYNANDDTLLITIDDSKSIGSIIKGISMGEGDLYTETETVPNEEIPEYKFVFCAEIGSASRDFSLITYKDSDFICNEFKSLEEDGTYEYVIYSSERVAKFLKNLVG